MRQTELIEGLDSWLCAGVIASTKARTGHDLMMATSLPVLFTFQNIFNNKVDVMFNNGLCIVY